MPGQKVKFTLIINFQNRNTCVSSKVITV